MNDDNPVDNLSTEQLRDIYAGKITNWKEVGGEDLRIQVINRDEASGTREAFRTIVMDGTPFDRRSAVLSGTGPGARRGISFAWGHRLHFAGLRR